MEKEHIEKEVFISIFLDTRRAKANGNFPVKLRVFTPQPRKQKLYPTKFEFTEKEFKSIWETSKPQLDNKIVKKQIEKVEEKAEEIAEKIRPFDFEQFEKLLYRNKGEGANIFYHYEIIIQNLENNNQYGTASNYSLSKKSLIDFMIHEKVESLDVLLFSDITLNWLTKYENYMIETLKRSPTTVSMYLRALRTVFNIAISEKEIDSDMYPFRRNEQEKNKYIIPTGENVKKALDKIELKKLFEAEPKTSEQAKAKDFWFFSYSCNGMNIKDIVLLKYKDLKNDTIEFYRAKTKRTTKKKTHKIVVNLSRYALSIIEKYGNPNKDQDQYIFSIISEEDSNLLKHNKIKNFTKFINQNLKILAASVSITDDISTYWARHSMATQAIIKGASMEFVSEALGHNNLKTTQNYFAGFPEKDKKKFMEKMMKF
jgi:integrase/recombinase XerD